MIFYLTNDDVDLSTAINNMNYIPAEILCHVFTFIIEDNSNTRMNVIYSNIIFNDNQNVNLDISLCNIRKYGIDATLTFFKNIINLRYVCKKWYNVLLTNSLWYQIYSSVYKQSINNGLDLNKYCTIWDKNITWYEIFRSRFKFELKHIYDNIFDDTFDIINAGMLIYNKYQCAENNKKHRYLISTIEQFSNIHVNDNCYYSAINLYSISFNILAELVGEVDEVYGIHTNIRKKYKIVDYFIENISKILEKPDSNINIIRQLSFIVASHVIDCKNIPDLFDKYSNFFMVLYNIVVKNVIHQIDNINHNNYNNSTKINFDILLLTIEIIKIKIKKMTKDVLRDAKEFDIAKYIHIFELINRLLNDSKEIYHKLPNNDDSICYYISYITLKAEYMICVNNLITYSNGNIIYHRCEIDECFNLTARLINCISDISEIDIYSWITLNRCFIETIYQKIKHEINHNDILALMFIEEILKKLYYLDNCFEKFELTEDPNIYFIKYNNIIRYIHVYDMKLKLLKRTYKFENSDKVVCNLEFESTVNKLKNKIIILKDKPMKYYLLARLSEVICDENELKSNLLKYAEMKKARHRMRWNSINSSNSTNGNYLDEHYYEKNFKENIIYVRDFNDFSTIRNLQLLIDYLQTNKIN